MKFLTDEQLKELQPAETSSFASPVPTQIVSSDEYMPVPQTEKQREVEARLKDLSDRLARRQGLSRRRFFQTASGMAASFLVMNQVFGRLFEVSEAEAATPDMAAERAQGLSSQFVIDGHTHFLRDDTRLTGFLKGREAVGKAGWNKDIGDKEQTLDDLKYANYIKEIYMDSDTKVALLTNSPSEVSEDWFLPQEQVFKTREQVNKEAGSRRMMAHFTITPGWPGWLDQVDQAIEIYKPDSWKGYTIGDNTHKELANYPFHLDDEKLMYPFYEKAVKSGIRNVCIHKGLFAPAVEEKFPRLRAYADVNDVGKAAKDWPQINFLIYHSGYRWIGVRQDRSQLMGQRPRRDPRKIRRYQCLRRFGAALCLDSGRRASPRRGTDGHAGQGARRRPCAVGHRCAVDRRAAVADRGTAPSRNPAGDAEAIRLQAAGSGRRPDQERDLRREHGAPLQFRQARRARQARPLCRDQGRLCQERPGPQQPTLRLGQQRGLTQAPCCGAPWCMRRFAVESLASGRRRRSRKCPTPTRSIRTGRKTG
jgi:hypothetical protein